MRPALAHRLLLLTLAATAAARAALAPAEVEFFEQRIRPVLAQDCYECHRTSGKMKAGLALDHRAALLKGGDTGPAVTPGDPKNSLLLQAIRHEHDDLQMPKAGAKLDAAVVADFEHWVARGAPDPRDAPATEAQVAADTDWPAVLARRKTWWSFQPLHKIDPPDGSSAHPVDRFLAARQSAAGLAAASRADPSTLARRLSFALTGLPPTANQRATFSDQVETLLASPRFGERWARHWMDWVRYADSHGSEGDPPIPHAWRYRDYLIRALNADVPYDQLVREHLAGDLLPTPRLNPALRLNESILGIAQLRMVQHGFAPTDALEELVRFTDDQINVVSKTFLGLTLSCARCHDHKFDPISQRDFTSWHGIFSSPAPALLAVDAPDPAEPARRAALDETKAQLRAALAAAWLADADTLAARLTAPDAETTTAIAAAKKPDAALHPFFLLGQGQTADAALEPWRNQFDGIARHRDRTFPQRWDLSHPADLASWRRDGPALRDVSLAGAFAVAAEGDRVLTGVYPAGVYSHPHSTKDRGVLLSPRIPLDQKYDLWLRLAGEGGSFTRYAVQNYPRQGTVYPVQALVGTAPRWIKLPLDYWQGDTIHVEFSTAADQPVVANTAATRSWFGVSEMLLVRTDDLGPFEAWPFAAPLLAALNGTVPADRAALAAGFASALRASAAAWRDGRATDGDAELLDQMLRAGLVRNRAADLPDAAPLLAAYREAEAALRIPTRAPGVIEMAAADAPLFARGDHKRPGATVSRYFLEALDATPFATADSGRLALAEAIVDRGRPLAARVIVNRVWHHLFGRGLVATPDNLGRMGEPPSHPELLDYLATWFVEHRWSLKTLIRFLVTTDTWQLASTPPPGASEKDPDNRLLAHAPVRRLEAEAIRDALLAVAGELKADEMSGPPVLGAVPRRSVYVRVKRNDLDPFLAAFDAPVPATTVGRRDITNVPGQSLTLLNDVFVRDLATRWAARLADDPTLAAPATRIPAMYRVAFGRPPTAAEQERAATFVATNEHESAAALSVDAESAAKLSDLSTRIAALDQTAASRALARRTAGTPPAVTLPEPIASWDFAVSLDDQRGALHGRPVAGARIDGGVLALDGKTAHLATAPLTRTLRAKTLEAWVRLGNLTQRGGGVMTVQTLDGKTFDAIVFGEREPGRWMAGSNVGARTQPFGGPTETGATKDFVHLAITYAEDGTIAGYRNGEPYGQPYHTAGLVAFEPGTAQILFGNRHGPPGGSKILTGALLRARLYDRALTAAEVAASAAGAAGQITAADRLAELTGDERATRERLETERAGLIREREAAERKRGFTSPWADLAHALFNTKEFLYVR